jgi:hypothetical protein
MKFDLDKFLVKMFLAFVGIFFAFLLIVSTTGCKSKKQVVQVKTDSTYVVDSTKTATTESQLNFIDTSKVFGGTDENTTTIKVTFDDTTTQNISIKDLKEGVFKGKNIKSLEITTKDKKTSENAQNGVVYQNTEINKDSTSLKSETDLKKTESKKEKSKDKTGGRITAITIFLVVLVIVYFLIWGEVK